MILAIKLLIVYLILSEKSVAFSQAHNILLFLDLSDDLLNALQNFVKSKTNLFLKITVPLQFSLPSVFCAVHSRESIDDLFPFHHICGLRSLDPAFIYRCLLRWFCFLAFLFFFLLILTLTMESTSMLMMPTVWQAEAAGHSTTEKSQPRSR